jgi:aryl-alcohol dehydrogenase-like predicted oxidoreductase
LILGTAQLGLDYGISNKMGRPSIENARNLLETSKKNGVFLIDTAHAYGNSESVIGKINLSGLEVISKLPDLSKKQGGRTYQEIKKYLAETLSNTKQKQLNTYLLHSIDNLHNDGQKLWNNMIEFKDQGLTKKIGYSLYNPKQLEMYFERFRPDVVQIPMNLIDREFYKADWLKKLKDNGVEIHVRSIFLQGLLLMNFESQMLRFPKHKLIWLRFQQELKNLNMNAIQYCLSFVKGIKEIDEIIVGVNSANELEEIIKSDSKLIIAPEELASSDESLIYPFNW